MPEISASINKKLGGPTAPAPMVSTSSTAENTSRGKRIEPDDGPGLARKPRKPLHRVASESTSQKQPRHPSLVRSGTDSQTVPGLKREGSERPLSGIPLLDTRSTPTHRSSTSQLRHLNRREMDLTAISAANEAKMKKRAAVEEELRSAIGTLKKPNRVSAIKEYVDSADQRILPGSSVSRRGPNAGRRLGGIQVTATPKRLTMTKQVQPTPVHPGREPASGSTAFVPSSGIRPPPSSFIPDTGHRSAGAAMRGVQIDETPSRGAGKKVSFFPEADIDADRAGTGVSAFKLPAKKISSGQTQDERSAAQPAIVHQTPSRQRHADFLRPETPGDAEACIVATPQKQTKASIVVGTPVRFRTFSDDTADDRATGQANNAESDIVKRHVETQQPQHSQENGGVQEDTNIYAALGWDDDMDELA